MAANPDQYRLSEADHQAIFEQDIKPDLFAGAKPSSQPVAVIFGGQPGAGKSAAVDSAMRELEPRGGAVQIIGDDLRGYHLHYARLMERDDKTAAFYTDRDTGQWVEKAIAEAKAQRVNIVIEGTMRDGNKVAATMESLRAAGYEIDARALAVNPRLSEQGILQRYENQKADRGTGRMTTPEAHRAAYNGMPATLERIERDKLADMLARPERQASADELRKVDDLRRQAKAELAAEVFRQEPPEKAVQQHPELAPAYGYMRAREAKAEADGLNEQQRAIVMARVRQNVAERIERGDVPSVQIREERQIKVEQQRDPER